MHVHVAHPDGEAKFWLTPHVEMVNYVGLSARQLSEAERIVNLHFQEICNAWNKHFAG